MASVKPSYKDGYTTHLIQEVLPETCHYIITAGRWQLKNIHGLKSIHSNIIVENNCMLSGLAQGNTKSVDLAMTRAVQWLIFICVKGIKKSIQQSLSHSVDNVHDHYYLYDLYHS